MKKIQFPKSIFNINISPKKVLTIFVILFIFCSSLLVISSCIPMDRVRNNITKSVNMMNDEGQYPRIMFDSPYLQMDNWTEASILNFIYNQDNQHPFKSAFAQSEYHGQNVEGGLTNLIACVNDYDQSEGSLILRSSYWLGYRSILTFFLQKWDYYQIRWMLAIVSMLIFFCTVIMIGRELNILYALEFCGAMLLGNGFLMVVNISLGMFCLWISCFAILYLIFNHKKENSFYVLFICGIMTAFLEWFPLSILTFGLVTIYNLLITEYHNVGIKFKEFFIELFTCSLGWIIGFLLMYVGRLIVSLCVIGNESINYFITRFTTNVGVSSNALETLDLEHIKQVIVYCINGVFPVSMYEYNSTGVVKLCIVVAAILILCFLLCPRRRSIIVAIEILMLSPFVWLIVFSNYASVHFWIIYRVLIIAILGFWVIIGFFVEELFTKLKRRIKRNGNEMQVE